MIDELLAYQEADGRLRAIEQKISATDERKKYVTARKFLEKAPKSWMRWTRARRSSSACSRACKKRARNLPKPSRTTRTSAK